LCYTAVIGIDQRTIHSLARPPKSTPFPYTTLFRSVSGPPCHTWRMPSMMCNTAFERNGSTEHITAIKGSVNEYGGTVTFEGRVRSEEHTSELQSLRHLVCRLLLEKKKTGERPVHDC